MLSIVFQPQAERDLQTICNYYDDLEPGVGRRFAAAVAEQLTRAALMPQAFPIYMAEWRKARPYRFPYLILFELDGDRLIVAAIVHGHRDPNYIERRLDPQSGEDA